MENALKDVDSISCVTFTGGEPSLFTQAIRWFIDIVQAKNITVDSFYVVTNGLEESKTLAYQLLKLYTVCETNELSCLCISDDQYHREEREDTYAAVKLYSGLSFFRADGRKDIDERYILDEGRACEVGIGRRSVDIPEIEYEDDAISSTVYINALGGVIPCCDLSYSRQEEEKIGNVNESSLKEIFDRVVQKE
jgi:hypothetical protein